MEMQNLNEVLPKYKISRNGRVVVVSDSYDSIVRDYNIMLGSIPEHVTLEILEDNKVVKSKHAN